MLNCVNNSSVDTCEYNCDTSYEDLEVSAEEVTHAIKKLNFNKAWCIFRTYKICIQHTCAIVKYVFY